MIKSESAIEKINILNSKSILKHHKDWIYINVDLMKKEREIQKIISEMAAEESGMGN